MPIGNQSDGELEKIQFSWRNKRYMKTRAWDVQTTAPKKTDGQIYKEKNFIIFLMSFYLRHKKNTVKDIVSERKKVIKMNFPSFENEFWQKIVDQNQTPHWVFVRSQCCPWGRQGWPCSWKWPTAEKCSPIRFARKKSRNTHVQIPSDRLKPKASITCILIL